MRVRFDAFVLDSDAGTLTRDGHDRPLSRKAVQMLALLLERRPRAAAHEELREELWSTASSSRRSVSSLVTELRKVLGDDASAPRYIKTVHGVGYSFCGNANDTQPLKVDSLLPPCSLLWGDRAFVLVDGNNLIGRTADCHVVIESPLVSRHHACVKVSAKSVSVEDLGSRNGTLLQGKRLAKATPLKDGDLLTVGPALLLYCGRKAPSSRAGRT